MYKRRVAGADVSFARIRHKANKTVSKVVTRHRNTEIKISTNLLGSPYSSASSELSNFPLVKAFERNANVRENFAFSNHTKLTPRPGKKESFFKNGQNKSVQLQMYINIHV